MKNNLHRAIYFLTFMIAILYSLYEGWYSITILWLLFSFCFFFSLMFFFKNEKRETTKLFMLFFGFYSLYMFITNFLFVKVPGQDFFAMFDSMKFWDNSNFVMNDVSQIFDNFNKMIFITIKYRIFNFNSISLSYFAQLFDENNMVVQKLQNVFLGAFSIPFIYLILRKFFSKDKSYNYAIIFGLFSLVPFYSIVYNRDCYIYFFFTLGFYLLIYSEKIRFIPLKLLIILLIVFFIRFEHGLFFIIFLFAYYYLKSKRNKAIAITMIFVFPIIFIFSAPFFLSNFSENDEKYNEKILNSESKRTETSTGGFFAKLPIGVKQLTMAVNGQIAPAIPFWRYWFNSERTGSKEAKYDGYRTPWRFMESIGGLFQIYVWAFIFYGFRKKYFKDIPLEIKVSFFIAILLLLASSSIANPRRYYCVYSVLFFTAIFCYERTTKKTRNNIFVKTSFFLMFLHILYFGLTNF